MAILIVGDLVFAIATKTLKVSSIPQTVQWWEDVQETFVKCPAAILIEVWSAPVKVKWPVAHPSYSPTAS